VGRRVSRSEDGQAAVELVAALPFVVLNVGVSLAALDRRLPMAAAGLGARELHVFRTVTLPLIMPGVIAGALMALTHGLVLQRRPRPQGSPDPAGHMIKLILKGLFEIARPASLR